MLTLKTSSPEQRAYLTVEPYITTSQSTVRGFLLPTSPNRNGHISLSLSALTYEEEETTRFLDFLLHLSTMGSAKRSKDSSERRNWQTVFNACVQMLRSQQKQIESLVRDRELLENRIEVQHDRWVYDSNLFQDQISQMENDLKIAGMLLSVQAAKLELMVGLKEREGSLYKTRFESAKDELEDFKLWFDYLTAGSCDAKETDQANGTGETPNLRSLKSADNIESSKTEREVRRLKREYEKLTMKNNSEVAALVAERNFVWNQYKMMEKDYTSQLDSERTKVWDANEKIQKLLANMEQLQMSNIEKDNVIEKLKAEVANMETETNKRVSQLSAELELLRKSKFAASTPVLSRCTKNIRNSSVTNKKDVVDRSIPVSRKESQSSQSASLVKVSGKEKRKEPDSFISSSVMPKLFSSNFKVPKLKNSSPYFDGNVS
ncbi:hypothetical protein RJ641_028876 [Dillenia turbinata]|uniref:Uncharacterized protein n=1 Tax=Dillenia turbinata TaxID=194707 RepID=A0AAN8ZME2_9MAGN